MAPVDEGATEFGRVVERLRNERNMSQERVAELAGLSDGYISLIERGQRGKRPGRDTVLALAQAFNVDANVLLQAAGLPLIDRAHSRPSFEAVVKGDPLLRADQKDVLTRLYSVFVRGTAG